MNMHIEKRIDESELMMNLKDVFQDILSNETVYFVGTKQENWKGNFEFVLAPHSIGSRVCGLLDQEYGWPHDVRLEDVQSVWTLSPSRRRHPFITAGEQLVAVGIQVAEYEDILSKKPNR